MYILIREELVASAAVLGRLHERMPDGRLILTPAELKMLGSVAECQVVATARELKAMVKAQAASQPGGAGEAAVATETTGPADSGETIDSVETIDSSEVEMNAGEGGNDGNDGSERD